MSAIMDFLHAISSGVQAAIEFLANLISDIAYLAQSCASVIASLPQYFGWLPPPVWAGLVALFGIVVIYQIIGRQ